MRKYFIQSLEKLNTDLIELGAMCEQAVDSVNKALVNNDVDVARELIATIPEITAFNRRVEANALNLVLRQQPVASDFRRIQATLKILADLDRIANMCGDLSQLLVYMSDYKYKVGSLISDMALATKAMINASIESYVKMDLELCENTISQDDIVDNYFSQVKDKLEHSISKSQKIQNVVLDKLMVAKYLERIADHAENIAQWVKYALTGTYKGESL